MATIDTNEILNEIKCPFKFYDSIIKKNRFRLPNRNSDPFKLICSQYSLLPFMFTATPQVSTQGVQAVEVFSYDSGTVTYTLDSSLIHLQIKLRDYYFYNGDQHGEILPCGFYYLIVTLRDGRRYFSEDFYVQAAGYAGNFCLNGRFDNTLNGWNNTIGNVVMGTGRASFPVDTYPKKLSQTPSQSGAIRVTFTIEDWTGSGSAYLNIGGVNVGSITGNGIYSFYSDSGGLVEFNAAPLRAFNLDDVEFAFITNDSMDCNIMMEWGTDGCDFGNQFYGDGFFNRFIFPDYVDLFESKVKITKQGTKNGFDDDVDQFLKRQIIYHVSLVAPEFIFHALCEMSIHPNKTLVLKRGGRAKMFDVVVTGKPVLDASMYEIDIDFSVSEIVETNCCDSLEGCLEACGINAYDVPSSACVEGRVYIGADKSFNTCVDGELVSTPCDSGLMTNALFDNSATHPPYWLWNDETGEWDEAPAIWDIQSTIGVSTYRIFALTIPNSVSTLQYSSDGGNNWSDFGNGVHTYDQWLAGVQFELLEGTTYLFRINNNSSSCDYGISVPISYTTQDLDPAENLWIAPHYHKIWRQAFTGVTLNLQLVSLNCGGVEQLTSLVNFVVDASNALFAIGTDGNLYLTNIIDQINPLLPTGYECFDDMRVVKYPVGEQFSFTIYASITAGAFTEDWTYSYDNTGADFLITP